MGRRGYTDAVSYTHLNERADDDALAGQALSERAKKRGGQGNSQRGGGDSHSNTGFGGMEEVRKQREQRLRAVKLEKGADAAEGYSRRGPRAGRWAVRLGVEFQCLG